MEHLRHLSIGTDVVGVAASAFLAPKAGFFDTTGDQPFSLEAFAFGILRLVCIISRYLDQHSTAQLLIYPFRTHCLYMFLHRLFIHHTT